LAFVKDMAQLDSLRWFSQRRSWTPHFWGCTPRVGLWPPQQTDTTENIQRSSLRYSVG